MKFDVLDHGYLKLVESWGSDGRVIESARMSTDGKFHGWAPRCKHCGLVRTAPRNRKICSSPTPCEKTKAEHEFVPGDEKLLQYLWENKHSTPFEMCGLIVEVKAPIFVFRQWQRHRTQSYNEMSSRYTPIPDEHYIPTIERLMMSGGKNKQAGGSGGLTELAAMSFRALLNKEYQASNELYQDALESGIPKELARLAMPVGRYSKMRASANLRNWLGFLTLRTDSHAQWEIRQYANALGEKIADLFPRTWELFAK